MKLNSLCNDLKTFLRVRCPMLWKIYGMEGFNGGLYHLNPSEKIIRHFKILNNAETTKNLNSL